MSTNIPVFISFSLLCGNPLAVVTKGVLFAILKVVQL